METDLQLLQQTTAILVGIAKFYVHDTGQYATAARTKVYRHGRRGKDAFYASVLSSLSLLYHRLDQCEHDDIDMTIASSQTSVQRALESYERLVPCNPDETKPSPRFDGLARLIKQYADDTTVGRTPGYRRYLCTASEEVRYTLRDSVEACCEALENATLPMTRRSEDTSILPELDSIEEWRAPASMTSHAKLMHKVMSQYWDHDCPIQPEAHLAFLPYLRDHDALGSYRLCFAEAEPREHERSTATLHLDQGYDEILARSVSHERSPKRRRIVQFDSPRDAPTATWQTSTSLRSTFRDGENGMVIRISEGSLKFCVQLENNHAGEPQKEKIAVQSLRMALKDESAKSLGPKDRIIVGVLAAYMYLFLGETEWWDETPDIWFVQQERLVTNQPFLRFRSKASPDLSARTFEMRLNQQRPSLPVLGKLLLEIWKGRNIVLDELETILEECRHALGGEYWLCAINACLGGVDEFKQPGSLRNTGRLRSLYVQRVVKSLQWLLEKLCLQTLDEIFSDAIGNGAVSRVASRSNTAVGKLGKTDKGKRASGSDVCLHDDSDEWEGTDKNRLSAADTWNDLLRTRVHSFLSEAALLPLHLHPSRPVRIAVIDTGVSFSKTTAHMYGRRIGEIRSWVCTADSVNGVAQQYGDDSDGHGTHAASVVLNTDPFCEVYVAKVFEGRSEKFGASTTEETHQAIARAMNYAIYKWKVQVISMSFGYNEYIDVINDELLNAEHAGIVVIAAASNYGSNRDETWPARHHSVICMYAADGYGNKYPRNPTPREHTDSFAALGMEVKAWWQPDQKALRSGTSTATPIAAAIVSLVIRFVRDAKTRCTTGTDASMSEAEYEKLLRRLSTFSAMSKVLRLMGRGKRDGYNPLEPWRLLSAERGRAKDIVHEILEAVRSA
ncbi:hypothetical protein LTR17_013904 [Elasticomyces elasticus]|nr:hypothetical protein LTR17_013904 [Elasticomyces elasticus]